MAVAGKSESTGGQESNSIIIVAAKFINRSDGSQGRNTVR
ncbi:hypothetical protein MGWOODY_Clf1987 [hydrothermal vent metagenome]|uniref:Uncharacterized protein n=1 Tax=hydrothermal vent metagenome TaxID=652676 RepID=A0A170Q9I6_9ZZZZ